MNYLDLLNIKYNKGLALLIVVFIIGVMLTIFFNKDICEVYKTYAYQNEGSLVVNIGIDNPLVISEFEYIKVGGKSYNGEIKNISDIILDKDNLINYQIVNFKSDYNYQDNQVFEISLFYNKEKVYKKILRMLF